jgi:hypothetical protein
MRFPKGLLVGLVAAGLVGCSNAASGQPFAGLSSSAPAQASPAPPVGPAEPKTQTGARAAATHFYDVYLASQFAASWDLLAPAAKRQVSKGIWIKVHEGCLSAGSGGKIRVIKSVTVFGDAAIITESLAGTHSKHRTARSVFNYSDGHWGYAPNNLSIYHHRSVAADVAAARAAGLCSNWNDF